MDLTDIKLPPHNIEAEKGVISSILMDNQSMYILDDTSLIADDFYQKEHTYIMQAINTLWADKKNIDIVTISDRLKKDNNLDLVWWVDYLYDLNLFVTTPAICGEYVKIVKEKSILRQILKTCQNIIWDVYSEKDTDNIIENIEQKIFELSQYSQWDSLKHIKDILDQRVSDYMDIVDNPDIINEGKTLSEYSGLDDITWWFKPGELVILAARPSMGKTAFWLNITINAAIGQKKSIAVFSLEMSTEQIIDRMVSVVSWINMSHITKWILWDTDYEHIWDAVAKLSETNIYVDEESNTIPVIKSKLRKLAVEKGKVDLVVIDYMQLINSTGMKYAGNRVQEISEISRALKELAKELKCPIITLSQLSRENEKRMDKKPILSDLRDSGSIEQDADLVMFLYRDEYYYPEDIDNRGKCDVLVRKNRNGMVWDIVLKFVWEKMKFEEL